MTSATWQRHRKTVHEHSAYLVYFRDETRYIQMSKQMDLIQYILKYEL